MVGLLQIWGTMGVQGDQLDSPELHRVPLDPAGYALLLAAALALVLRHRLPGTVLTATLVLTAIYTWLGYAYGPAFLAPIFATYTAVIQGRRLIAWLGGAAYFAFVVISINQDLFHSVAVAAFVVLVLTASEVSRGYRERQAARRRTAEEEARRRASEERLAMARELHDVLAHNISLIHVQAATALHLIDDRPEQARTALAAIKQASKDVLTEMRSVLAVLREEAPRSPTAGLDRLDELIERTGLPVRAERTGRVRPLPPGVDRAAYRIVQEALTNVTKHAPGSATTVHIGYGERELTLRVHDDGAGRPGVLTTPLTAESGGNGLPGMRERAVALGGTLTAGPDDRGGFTVAARLPIPEETT